MRKLNAKRFRQVVGTNYGTPKELWGFETERAGTATQTVKTFLARHADVIGIERELSTLSVQRRIESLAAEHIILQQKFRDARVHRAYVTGHVRHDGGVYLLKNRAVPEDLLRAAKPGKLPVEKAVRCALRAVGRGRAACTVIGKPESLWYPLQRSVQPAWRVRVHRERPRSEWIVYVNARTGQILQKLDNLASTTARASVFVPNPMAGDPSFEPLLRGRVRHPPDSAYRNVQLRQLSGSGKLDGKAVSTVLTHHRVRSTANDYRRAHTETGFEEVSAYYHACAGLLRLNELGYTGRRRIFREVLRINAQGTREDNSWYSPGTRTLTFGLGDVDDAEDGETVLHELGHAIQDAICPDFGQSPEAAAMGEGFGDYFAGSYFAEAKPERYRLTVMSWDGAHYRDPEVTRLAKRDPQAAAALERSRPACVRRLDSPLTYESFDHGRDADEHANGEIWAATLWEVREAVGREVADRIIIDSHFQLDGFTTFARGARAILDADRNLNRGRHLTRLRRIFRRRGIGPVD